MGVPRAAVAAAGRTSNARHRPTRAHCPCSSMCQEVGTDVVIGPNAKKPLHLDIPLFVS